MTFHHVPRADGIAPLRRFFKFYGSKASAAHRYPAPEHDLLIEPFAGSAGYALRYHDRRVVLTDLDPVIADVWAYLIAAPEREILSLPDVGEEGIHALPSWVPQEARWLIGMWLNVTHRSPNNYPSAWMLNGPKTAGDASFWSQAIRERIASQQRFIRHWRVFHASYEALPNAKATWFVDPPYDSKLGSWYRHSSRGRWGRGPDRRIDFAVLADWCRERRGQTIVCEAPGASWLPFRAMKASSKDVVWEQRRAA